MVDYKLYGTLSGSVDDVMHTVGEWANQKYKDVCEELDEANRIIQELKDELEGNVVGNYATTQTVQQYEYEIKGLETTIATNRDREQNLVKDYNDLHVKYEELKYKCSNTVSFSRYEAMLTDYINLVSKVKDGTALAYIMSLK
jgi:predicted nuclease with TOPRIM domain